MARDSLKSKGTANKAKGNSKTNRRIQKKNKETNKGNKVVKNNKASSITIDKDKTIRNEMPIVHNDQMNTNNMQSTVNYLYDSSNIFNQSQSFLYNQSHNYNQSYNQLQNQSHNQLQNSIKVNDIQFDEKEKVNLKNCYYGMPGCEKLNNLADMCFQSLSYVDNGNKNYTYTQDTTFGEYPHIVPTNPFYIPPSYFYDDIRSAHVELSNTTKEIRKGKWSKEEDKNLLLLINEFGINDWSFIGEHMTTRTSKQCRERYLNNLDPSLNKTPFNQKEKKLIIKLQRELGNKWKDIAERLDNRSENAIKNFYYSYKKTKNRNKNI
ncbi:MYB98 [Hepatospora eriocheir]|uniref:MYB98 n=1 Tax=Hepatospora eriocheir TaxID=1081669 RepID=A0A1X0QJJ6_9MICR|nr:MYB98 [Hepatospora eriocheir]